MHYLTILLDVNEDVDLIDDKKMLDWDDILLPYEYDKFCSMKINSLLNYYL